MHGAAIRTVAHCSDPAHFTRTCKVQDVAVGLKATPYGTIGDMVLEALQLNGEAGNSQAPREAAQEQVYKDRPLHNDRFHGPAHHVPRPGHAPTGCRTRHVSHEVGELDVRIDQLYPNDPRGGPGIG